MLKLGSMGSCLLCGSKSKVISDVIGVCASCLRRNPSESLKIALRAHANYRESIGLPPKLPQAHEECLRCSLCVNECLIPPGGMGFCGLWSNSEGRLKPIIGWDKAVVYWYLDPLPTNCVATPVCPAATGAGYPKYTLIKGPEYGMFNLAVFFAGCNLDCLFCQNWEHKEIIVSERLRIKYIRSVDDLVEETLRNDKITCICFFGGDPGPQILYAIKASRKIVEHASRKGLIKRICWETNGLVNPAIMREMAKLSLVSGGIVKIDWKAWSPPIYQALTGVNGVKAVERLKINTKLVADLGKERPEVPLLVVSTLLVPGYVDEYEVGKIAEYISSLGNEIPYVLLAFHPDHLLRDLPPTSLNHALRALRKAKEAGLKHIFIGNEWLLGNYY